MAEDLLYGGASAVAAAVRSGEVSAVDVARAALDRIARLDGELNAFTVVLGERALAEAEERDAAAASGEELGPLHGVPVAIKDENDVADCVTTFGTGANRTPAQADGEVVRRLRAAGAVIVGKTTMPEFGQWPFTETQTFGITRNPWDHSRTTGGSSGGTAAAVAAGLVPAAIGGDGGGSIRIPAACCGLFGLKPTRGRVTSSPHPHLWWALGTVGPLTRNVADSALIYDVIRGGAPGDRFAAPEPAQSFTEAATLGAAGDGPRLRIGFSTKSTTRGVRPDPEHVQAVQATAALLEQLGHHVTEVDPRYPDMTPAFVTQFFGGVRTEAFQVEDYRRLELRTRQIVRLGSWVRPAVLERAMAYGEKLADRVDRVFGEVDVLLTPTIAHRPPTVPALGRGGPPAALVKAMPMIAYTALWNVTGHPAAAVPAGIGADGVPLSVQLVGRRGDEPTLLALSAELEQARPWEGVKPIP